MGAGGFVTLASHFPDRTVVTYDPRGVERSVKADPATQSTPEQHADDLHRIIAELGGGPVDLFASSGGAVNALALVAAHPEQVRTLVAHEPPLASILPDREGAMAATQAIADTYQRSGFGPAMAQFIARREPQGPDDARSSPPSRRPTRRCSACPPRTTAPAPTRCCSRTSSTCTHYEPDFDALRAASTRIVLAAGAESEGEMAHRGAEAVAERLGTARGHLPERPRRLPRRRIRPERASRTPSPRSCARSSPRPERQRKAAGFGAENAGSGQAPGDELGAALECVVTAGRHAAVQLEEVRSIDDEDPADGPAG